MSEQIVTVGNWTGDLEIVANMMDDELRERVHAEGIEDPQAFVDRYVDLHRETFGEDFVVN